MAAMRAGAPSSSSTSSSAARARNTSERAAAGRSSPGAASSAASARRRLDDDAPVGAYDVDPAAAAALRAPFATLDAAGAGPRRARGGGVHDRFLAELATAGPVAAPTCWWKPPHRTADVDRIAGRRARPGGAWASSTASTPARGGRPSSWAPAASARPVPARPLRPAAGLRARVAHGPGRLRRRARRPGHAPAQLVHPLMGPLPPHSALLRELWTPRRTPWRCCWASLARRSHPGPAARVTEWKNLFRSRSTAAPASSPSRAWPPYGPQVRVYAMKPELGPPDVEETAFWRRTSPGSRVAQRARAVRRGDDAGHPDAARHAWGVIDDAGECGMRLACASSSPAAEGHRSRDRARRRRAGGGSWPGRGEERQRPWPRQPGEGPQRRGARRGHRGLVGVGGRDIGRPLPAWSRRPGSLPGRAELPGRGVPGRSSTSTAPGWPSRRACRPARHRRRLS